MTMTRLLLVLCLLFPVVAVAQPHDAGALTVTGAVAVEPSEHVLSATASSGDTFTIVDPSKVTLDSQPVLEQLSELRAQYAAVKAAKDKDARMLLWAALIATVLKGLLSLVNRIWTKPKKWTAWVAMAAAVPIALLSHFAAGNGWFDSLLFAGAGPGAIVVHELLKLFGKAKEPAKA